MPALDRSYHRRACGRVRLPRRFRSRIVSTLMLARGPLCGNELAARVLWPCRVTAPLWWAVMALADSMALAGVIGYVQGERALGYGLAGAVGVTEP